MDGEAERKHNSKSSRSSRDDRKRDKGSSSSRRHYRSRSRSDDEYSDNRKQRKRHRRSTSSRDERSKHSSSRRKRENGGESKEDRLLRKAKEYVAQQEKQQKDHQEKHKYHRHGDDLSANKSYESDFSQEAEEGRRKRKKKTSKRTKRDTRDHYDDDDDDKHTRKYKKKDRKKHKSSKNHDRHSKSSWWKKSKSSSAAKIIHRDDLVPLGTVVGTPPSPLLDVEKDYFAFHQHLWVYLYREEGIAFGDLTSEKARDAFGRFANKYNSGQLEGAYYDPKGLPSEAVDQCKTTRHTWSFNTSTTEQQRLQLLQEGVRKQTEYNDPTTASKKKFAAAAAAAASQTICKPVPQSNNEYQKRTPTEIAADRAAHKRLRTHIKTAEDELSGGRKDGRERQIEQRKERAARIHGSAQDREELRMGGGTEMDDKDIYGSGGAGAKHDAESFEVALAREKRNKARRDEKRSSRVMELQEKEQGRQEAMLKSLGLTGIKPGQKITIAPRRDT